MEHTSKTHLSCMINIMVADVLQMQGARPSVAMDDIHDDVIKWKHFPHNWPFVRGNHRSSVNSLHKGQWRGALIFFFICAWINSWVNNGEAGDLRRHRGHYDFIVMDLVLSLVPSHYQNQYWYRPIGTKFTEIWIKINSTWRRCFEKWHLQNDSIFFRPQYVKGFMLKFSHSHFGYSIVYNDPCDDVPLYVDGLMQERCR